MNIHIVMRNGKVDEVFDNLSAAMDHKANLVKKWAIAEIVTKEVKSL